MAGTGAAANCKAINQCKAVDLRCEYLEDPVGIDVVVPRLSWVMKSNALGAEQTACHILVASSKETLEKDQGDLWDSGKLVRRQSIHVEYAGKPLASRQRCHWKVRIWDHHGQASPWSKTAVWEMGLLRPEDWKAKWIGAERSDYLPLFRKEFTLESTPNRARAYVSALGYFEVYINGRKVGDDMLVPAVSDYSRRALYVVYDIAPYLHMGVNCVGVWLCRGWSTLALEKVGEDWPLVMAQLEVEPSASAAQMIGTDDSWLTHRSWVRALGKGSSGDYGGEGYDAGLEIEGWSCAGLDGGEWTQAKVCEPVTPIMAAQMCERNRVIERFRPVAITPEPDRVVVDMGKNYTGWFEIRFPKMAQGTKVVLAYADKIFPDGRAQTYNQRDEYIARGHGREVFCNRFNYHAFRYALITGLPRPPLPREITGMMICTDYEPATTFECSNPLLNDIYRTANHTYRCLSLGGYTVDCPHRERLGYGGDSGTSMEGAMTNFKLGAFFTKWSADWRDSQNEAGDVPYTAPYAQDAGGGPAWSGFCVTMPWQVYVQYGDRRILEQNYPTMKRWLAFIDTKVRDGILEPYIGIGCAGSPEWNFLGDWVPPGREQGRNRVDDRSTLFFNNCYWLYCLQIAAKTAERLRNEEDAAQYREQATALAARIHETFLNPGEATYVNREQPYLVMPLLFGVTPREMREQVMANLERDIVETQKGHLNSGMHGTYFMIKHLTAQNRNDLIYSMVSKDTYPSWGYMLARGGTTIWEEWDGDNSQIHDTLISVGMWFVQGLGGILPVEDLPGFKHIIIRPGFIDDLTFVKASQQSPYGRIRSEWTREDDAIRLDVAIPPNSTATVFLPASGIDSVTESGKPIKGRLAISEVECRQGMVRFNVVAGRYRFVIRSD